MSDCPYTSVDGICLPPIPYMQSEISTTLNSIVLFAFGMGLYTMVYLGSMYIYLTRRGAAETRIVAVTMSLLYILSLLQLISQWWSLPFSFVDNNESRGSIFLSLYSLPRWVGEVLNIPGFISLVLADCLLAWRCYHIWGRSLRMVAPPAFLIFTETVLFIAHTIFNAIKQDANSLISPEDAVTSNRLHSASYFLSFFASALTTVLIAWRIQSVSSGTGLHGRSRKRFLHISDIIIQSSIFYSLALLVTAIASVIPPTISSTQLTALILYSTAITVPIIGIAPTAMVARVALAASTPDYTTKGSHLSGLQFDHHLEETTEVDTEIKTTSRD